MVRASAHLLLHAHLDHICVVRVLQLRRRRNRFADLRRTRYM